MAIKEKIIFWYEELYLVNNKWNIKSLHFWKAKILKPFLNWRWYLIVDLRKNWKRKMKSIHRLVIETFKWPCPKWMECNHIDGNKLNNCVSNLEWITKSKNQEHKFRVIWYKNHFQLNHPNTWKFWKLHKYSKKVRQKYLNWNIKKEWDAIAEASRWTWIDWSCISKACSWKLKTAWKYIWEFI